MAEISRRSALTLGGIGAAAILAGGAGLIWNLSGGESAMSPTGGAGSTGDLLQPPLLSSANGRLEVALAAAPTTVNIGGIPVKALTYAGTLPGPTLMVRGGDTLAISVRNDMADPTNLHTHGLHVSPDGISDNIFRRIDAGATAEYLYEIPENHPPGVYWYHPHHHGMAADQVFGGLYGAIIVEDAVPLPVDRERVLVISDITFDAAGVIAGASQMQKMNGREGQTLLLNGQTDQAIAARPGDRERWRIVNACASRYVKLRLDGQSLQLLGLDSGRFPTPEDVTEITLMPGNRADALVTMAAGTSALEVVPVDRGSAGGGMGGGGMGGSSQSTSVITLATVSVTGAAATTRADAGSATAHPTVSDLSAAALTGSRTLTLAMGGGGMGGGRFTIDGKSFDENRVDTTVALGSVEEWRIVNSSGMDHPFHLHVWPMQVMDVGGHIPTAPTWQDVVNVPARSSTIVRIAFEDFGGTAVYHCHILDHEDMGMMGIIEVS
jgi:FtsP/CotA-like multicopper oxidase with cupredoxin domain